MELENIFIVLVIGIIIGFVMGIIISKKLHKNLIDYTKNKSRDMFETLGFMKSIFLVTSIVIFLAALILPYLGLDDSSGILLSFMSSFWVSWILTEYSSAKELEDKQRDLSIIYFRNSRSLTQKIDTRISCIESNLDKKVLGRDEKCKECIRYIYIEEIKEHLEDFKADVIQIQNNSSDSIAEEILNYYKLDDITEEIIELKYKIDDENLNADDEEQIESSIKELKKLNDTIIQKLDPRIKLLFDEEKRYKNIKKEKEMENDRQSRERPKPNDNPIPKKNEAKNKPEQKVK